MKKIILFALVTIAAACSKDAQPVDSKKCEAGTPVIINATIDNAAGSKVSFRDSAGIKGTWKATETMTVVSIKNSDAIAYDLFTSVGEEGRTSAEFTGTITSTDASEYVCYYPALKPSSDLSSANAFMSDSIIYCGTKDLGSMLYIPRSEVGSCYIQYRNSYVNQVKNNDVSHLNNRMVLKGVATMDGGKLKVQFKHMLTVMKLNLEFPATMVDTTVTEIDIRSKNSEDSFKCMFTDGGWGYIHSTGGFAVGGSSYVSNIVLGGWPEGGDGYPKGLKIPSDGKMTVYMITKIKTDVSAGDKWTVKAYDSKHKTVASRTVTWKEGKALEDGRMYAFDLPLIEVK